MNKLKMKLNNFYKNKKILITGHTGFKGSWLSQILIYFGAKISGYSLEPNTKPSLFKALNLNKKINHNIGDIRDYKNFKKIFIKEKPEIVFHLAAQPLIRDSYDDPLYTFETNIIGTANILQAIKETESVKSAVIITTDKVYKDKNWIYPYKENDELGGYDPYSSSKAGAEIITDSYIKSFFNPKDYNKKHKTLIASARAGNVIGGGDWQKDRLIPDTIRAIFEKKKEIIIRNPNSIRPWQYVLEPLYGYMLLAKRLYNGERKFSGAWNFGPDNKSFLTVKKLIEKSLSILEKGSYIIKKDKNKHEADLLRLDISKAKSVLSWQPVYDIDTTLQFTFDWYKSFYNKEDIINLTNKQIGLFLKKLK